MSVPRVELHFVLLKSWQNLPPLPTPPVFFPAPQAEARYRESVAHAAWTEKAACIQAVGAELDAHEQAARMANDATQRKQRAFQEARKRWAAEPVVVVMAAFFQGRD